MVQSWEKELTTNLTDISSALRDSNNRELTRKTCDVIWTTVKESMHCILDHCVDSGIMKDQFKIQSVDKDLIKLTKNLRTALRTRNKMRKLMIKNNINVKENESGNNKNNYGN